MIGGVVGLNELLIGLSGGAVLTQPKRAGQVQRLEDAPQGVPPVILTKSAVTGGLVKAIYVEPAKAEKVGGRIPKRVSIKRS